MSRTNKSDKIRRDMGLRKLQVWAPDDEDPREEIKDHADKVTREFYERKRLRGLKNKTR